MNPSWLLTTLFSFPALKLRLSLDSIDRPSDAGQLEQGLLGFFRGFARKGRAFRSSKVTLKKGKLTVLMAWTGSPVPLTLHVETAKVGSRRGSPNDELVAQYASRFPLLKVAFLMLKHSFAARTTHWLVEGGALDMALLMLLVAHLQQTEGREKGPAPGNAKRKSDPGLSPDPNHLLSGNPGRKTSNHVGDSSAEHWESSERKDAARSHCSVDQSVPLVGELLASFLYFFGWQFDPSRIAVRPLPPSEHGRCPFVPKGEDLAESDLSVLHPLSAKPVTPKALGHSSDLLRAFKLVYVRLFSNCCCSDSLFVPLSSFGLAETNRATHQLVLERAVEDTPADPRGTPQPGPRQTVRAKAVKLDDCRGSDTHSRLSAQSSQQATDRKANRKKLSLKSVSFDCNPGTRNSLQPHRTLPVYLTVNRLRLKELFTGGSWTE